jgi:hypothetical protein
MPPELTPKVVLFCIKFLSSVMLSPDVDTPPPEPGFRGALPALLSWMILFEMVIHPFDAVSILTPPAA